MTKLFASARIPAIIAAVILSVTVAGDPAVASSSDLRCYEAYSPPPASEPNQEECFTYHLWCFWNDELFFWGHQVICEE